MQPYYHQFLFSNAKVPNSHQQPKGLLSQVVSAVGALESHFYNLSQFYNHAIVAKTLVSFLLPVKIGLRASKFHKLSIFPMFSQEKKPLHSVNQKHRYSQLMPLSQVMI
jgi:hypothetical protein